MNIFAGGISIEILLKFESQFKNLASFKTSILPEYSIKTISEDFYYDETKLISSNKYFKKYDTDLGILQINFIDDRELGKILYKGKETLIYLSDNSFFTEYMLAQYAFAYFINNYTNNIFIHSSSIKIDEKGILLLAKSGVGKSTLRRELEEIGFLCINDDKNIIEFKNNEIYILPNPFAGKHFVSTNTSAKLTALVFIKQGLDNKISILNKNDALIRLLSQILLPSKKNKEIWNQNIDKLLNLTLIEYSCNISSDTARILYEFLEKDL